MTVINFLYDWFDLMIKILAGCEIKVMKWSIL